MTTLAAHAPAASSGPLVFLLVAVLLAYLASPLIWPWKKCLVCQDRKKFFAGHSSRIFRLCPRCHGKGKELRLGARFWRGLLGRGFDRHD